MTIVYVVHGRRQTSTAISPTARLGCILGWPLHGLSCFITACALAVEHPL